MPLICGVNEYTNTASFVTNDTTATDDASWTINATVACIPGCTLTQGYWKTHNASFKGGAPLDDTWDQILALKEQTPFYLSGGTWFKVFWTPPSGGNAYYQLAHQYMAAKLNSLNGAGMSPAVTTAFNSATTLLTSANPTAIGTLKGAAKNNWVNLVGTLGNYNEGNAGVPHCSEQNP